MKVQLKSNWVDPLSGLEFKSGWIIHVSDSDGAGLLALGHKQVADSCKATKQPQMFDEGCIELDVSKIKQAGPKQAAPKQGE